MAIYMNIGGRDYEIVDPDNYTWREWKEVKRMCGLGAQRFLVAITESDPDAWEALVMLSIRRVEPRAPDGLLDELNMAGAVAQVVSAWEDARVAEERAQQDAAVADLPPAQPTPTAPAPSPGVGENDVPKNGLTSDGANGTSPGASTRSPETEISGPAGRLPTSGTSG